ncbi:MAG: lipopolysaccharide biosynthesis regulator YciM [Pseudohongiellaceae bacterium]|jgi:lipopolysaccharide biosynthesis regulator YciM
MEIELLWGFLLLALLLGWLLGFYAKSTWIKKAQPYTASPHIKHRLQLLFDPYSDESIDQFVHSLEVNPETFSTHISIGKHFRTQGEVEKAILIHQNLMAHPELPQIASESVIYELAKDYKKAGLLDRAEALLQQLSTSKQYGFKSLKLLLKVYEDEKDWENAVSKGLELELKKYPEIALRVAQYCCELAEVEQQRGQLSEVQRYYKQALSINKACVRALIGLARLDIEQEECALALNSLKKVAIFSPENITLILPLLLECAIAKQTYAQHLLYLEKLFEETGQVAIMLAVVESLLIQGKKEKAYHYLQAQIYLRPSLSALDLMFKRYASESLNESSLASFPEQSLTKNYGSMWGVVAKVVDDLTRGKSAFRCQECGFSGAQHHWMCPSCKGWQSTYPIADHEHT